ncbi:MAG: DNA integrity scanning protein DisA nucleotide-binding domain protein [Deltaproteobacteria bacterium]|nr:DNA integrity scanning protein DisA nucleotide-binding domain protein [Deltaproteobacteria bacterium]
MAASDRFQHWFSLITEIGLSGLLDITIVTLAVYIFLVAVKRTRRSGLIFTGIIIVGLVYLAARKLNLLLTVALLQGFFAVFLVALIVIFQEDLRYFFERVASLWLERGLPLYKRKTARLSRREVEILIRSLSDLARAKIGALVVIRGKDPLARHLEGGEEIQGLLSEVLLKSIFDPHSPGHDGAVVIDGDRLEKLGAHLPLSTNFEKLPRSGTRHGAALGLAERSDALCLVVSEERGTISRARHGDLQVVSTLPELAELLESFYAEIAPLGKARPGAGFFQKNNREKALSFVVAAGLWIAVGYGSQTVHRNFEIPVGFSALPGHLTVAGIDPKRVRVSLSGHRRAFAFLRQEDIKLELNLWDIRKGRHPLAITTRALAYPPGLEIEDIEPRRVEVRIEDKPASKAASPKPG